tara:strand:+ start:1558 stop:1743 length:186 start_codon:yes stop_codon:yes gene_type:complete
MSFADGLKFNDEDLVSANIQNGDSTCNKGYKVCFFRSVKEDAGVVTEERLIDSEELYIKKS